jgi:ParB family chromosome partitioning protein
MNTSKFEDRAGELMLVPLSRLVASPKRNVRKSRPSAEYREGLKASIQAQGVLQNLIVCPALNGKGKETGNFEVVGGEQRRSVLVELAKEGVITREEEILCRVRPTLEAAEASLAENFHRAAMHPADEFEAFKRLVDDGKSAEDVALTFGVSPLTVRRRLRLGSVSPALLGLYREDQITLDQLMALAVSDDHAAQERVWEACPEWQRAPQRLRQLLTGEEVDAARDPVARFVGVKAFEDAGGVVRRDLFADEDAGHIGDIELLHRLAQDKLEGTAETVRAEGWGWVEARVDVEYHELSAFGRAQKGLHAASGEEQAEVERLSAERDEADRKLEALYDADEHDDEQAEALEEELAKLDADLDRLREARECWTDEIRSAAGALVTVDRSGGLLVHRGLVKPGDRKAAANASAVARGEPEAARAEKPGHSEALMRRLTAHRTVALQRVLADHTNIALAALAHNYVQRLWGETHWPESALSVRLENCDSTLVQHGEDELEAGRAWLELKAMRDGWGDRLPGDPEKLLPWLIALPFNELCDLLALCVALSLNAVTATEGDHASDAIAEAVGLDMVDWWEVSAAGYLQHVPKARILGVVIEAVSPSEAAAMSKLKKGELVARAEVALAGKRWLPSPLRRC